MKYYLKNLITGKTMFRFPNKEFLEDWLISLATCKCYKTWNGFPICTKETNMSKGNFFLENLCAMSISEYKKNKRIADKLLKTQNQNDESYLSSGVFLIFNSYDEILHKLTYCDYLWTINGYSSIRFCLKKSCMIVDGQNKVYDFSEILHKSLNNGYTKEYIDSKFKGVTLRYARFLLSSQREIRYKVRNMNCWWGRYDGRIPIKKYVPFDTMQDDCDYQSNNCLKVNYHTIRFRSDEYCRGSKQNWKDTKKRKAWMKKGEVVKQNKFKQDLWNCYYDVEYFNLNLED